MKLLVDGVFFQLARTGISRVWSSILPILAGCPGLEIVLLDRGGSPPLKGIDVVEFPSYSMASNAPADSFLIERFCKDLNIDVFTSTYYTTPLTIPSVLVVYDMIPEVLDFGQTERLWLEKQVAISFASHYLCISETTLSDLERFYPTVRARSIVRHCGFNRGIFKPKDGIHVEKFKSEFQISKPYYVLIGSRDQYKNGKFVFEAAQGIKDLEIELLCIGGEPQIDPDALVGLPANISTRRIEVTDEELACAYAGAEALIFPSLYEGFGMPVVEAMACGCPVITTRHGALEEIAGKAAFFISGRSEGELRDAMQWVRSQEHRRDLIDAGLERATLYNDDWSGIARGLFELLQKSFKEGTTPKRQEFFESWKRFRALQAEVDTYIPEHDPRRAES